MSSPRVIVYPDAGPDIAGHLQAPPLAERLARIGTLRVHQGAPADDASFQDRVAGAEAVILGWGLPDAVLRQAERLKLVVFLGIGAGNHVNLDLARERGIAVCNTPGYADGTVAEHTLALLLSLARHIPQMDASMRTGDWERPRPSIDLAGKRLGILGAGGIGARVARLAQAFGMEVVAWTARPSQARAEQLGLRFVALEELFATSDAISLHLALTPQTEGIVTADLLARMKPGALLVNTARGELVEEQALMSALEEGRILAALDVFHQEPLPPDHPLRELHNVVLTPHAGFNSPDAVREIAGLAVTALEAFFAGEPVNLVT